MRAPTPTWIAAIASALFAGALALGAPCTDASHTDDAEARADRAVLGAIEIDAYADVPVDDDLAYEDADGDPDDALLRRRARTRAPLWREWARCFAELPQLRARDAVASHAPRGPPSA